MSGLLQLLRKLGEVGTKIFARTTHTMADQGEEEGKGADPMSPGSDLKSEVAKVLQEIERRRSSKTP